MTNEDAGVVPTNNAGGGNIQGIGVGPKGEPGVSKKHNPVLKTMKRKTFAEFRKG